MYEYKKLDCGAELVYEKNTDLQAACIGIWVGAGSVCETKENSGVSHYIEHMFFKGTSKHNAQELAQRIDDLGASINAFTGKQATCFHIKSLTEVFPQAVDYLLEMLTDSVFSVKEMKRERGVILEEMKMYEDTPDDIIIDYIGEKVFKGSPLAAPIIGTRGSLKKISRNTILDYISQYYKTENMVISVVGNFDELRLEDQLNSWLMPLKGKAPERPVYGSLYTPGFVSKSRDITQSHIALSIPAYSLESDEFFAQSIVSDMLGGSMSSRLFQNIREKRGLAYSVFSAPISYSQQGMFLIYAGVTLGKEKETLSAIADELEKLGAEGLTQKELDVCKQRLKSSLIYSRESMNSRMNVLGKNRLLLGRNYTDEETVEEINAVTLESVNRICKEFGDFSRYSAAIVSKDKLDVKKLMR